jgi:hypothetical protein
MTTTPTNTGPNGRVARKSLAAEIDRLDALLEGLSDSLNESVADAVKEAVRQAVGIAVQTAIREVLTSPEILERLRATAPANATNTKPTPSGPGTFGRLGETLKGWASDGWSWAKTAVTGAWSVTKACCAEVKDRAEATWAWARSVAWLVLCLLYQVRRPMLIAAAVGVTVAAASYFAGPVIASALSGLGGMGLTLGTMLLEPWWRPLVPGVGSGSRA